MRKLVYVLVGLFALFALIKAYSSVRAEGVPVHQPGAPISAPQSPGSASAPAPAILPGTVK